MRIQSTIIVLAMIAFTMTLAFSQDTTKHKKEKMIKESQAVPGATTNKSGVVETSMGTFEIELYGSDAPKTVENFVKLAQKKYFGENTS